MKRIMVFVGLKIAESTGAIAIVLGFIFVATNPCLFCKIMRGIFTGACFLIVILAVVVVLVVGLYNLVKKNWEWSRRLTEKKKINKETEL